MSDSTPINEVTPVETPATEQAAPSEAPSTEVTQGEQAVANMTQAEAEEALPQLSPAQVEKLLATVKRRVKVDGEEIEVGIQDMEKDYQLRRASHNRMQEAAKMRQNSEELIKLLKTDPKKALTHPLVGADIRALAEEILSEALEQEMMDPKDKEIRDLKAKLQADEEAKAKAAEEARNKEMSAAEAYWTEQYQQSIPAALKATGLPVTNFTVQSTAKYLQNALNNNLDLGPEDVASLVKEDYQKQLKEFFSASDGEAIAALLGDEFLGKVRAYDVKRLKGTPAVVSKEEQPPVSKEKAERKEKVGMKDILAKLR